MSLCLGGPIQRRYYNKTNCVGALKIFSGGETIGDLVNLGGIIFSAFLFFRESVFKLVPVGWNLDKHTRKLANG